MDIGIVCDFIEERWYSMDFVADTLLTSLPQIQGMNPSRIRPPMKLRFSGTPLLQDYQAAFNLDRLLNRMHEYPRYLKHCSGPDVFHVVDHSYSNLVHVLPAERVVVTCHDLDTFRCLFSPEQEPRSYLFRRIATHILQGLQKASRIACDSFATRDSLTASRAVPPAKLEVVPLGINPVFTAVPDPDADSRARSLLGDPDPERPELLHVGSVIERKRIDVLLHVFAEVKKSVPAARLLRAGGAFTEPQAQLAHSLGIFDSVTVFSHLDQRMLAALYRRAAVALLPSDREGFGLPVAEAMACGAPVIATDLPVLRETGGDAALYCQSGSPRHWAPAVTALLRERALQGSDWRHRVSESVKQASQFTSAKYARRMAEIYSTL